MQAPNKGDTSLTPLPLTFLARCSPENFKLTAAGNFSPLYRSDTPLYKAKMSCMLDAGFDENVQAEWGNVIRGIMAIQASKKSEGASPSNMVVKAGSSSARSRHTLFQVFAFFGHQISMLSNIGFSEGSSRYCAGGSCSRA